MVEGRRGGGAVSVGRLEGWGPCTRERALFSARRPSCLRDRPCQPRERRRMLSEAAHRECCEDMVGDLHGAL